MGDHLCQIVVLFAIELVSLVPHFEYRGSVWLIAVEIKAKVSQNRLDISLLRLSVKSVPCSGHVGVSRACRLS